MSSSALVYISVSVFEVILQLFPARTVHPWFLSFAGLTDRFSFGFSPKFFAIVSLGIVTHRCMGTGPDAPSTLMDEEVGGGFFLSEV